MAPTRAHGLAFAMRLQTLSKLSQEWHQLTGDSFIVDVRPFRQDDIASGFAEVFKYAPQVFESALGGQLGGFSRL